MDPSLRSLVATIPSVIATSKSHNTIKAYISAFQRFERWIALHKELPAFPASPESVALYMLALGQSGASMATMNQAHFAIIWVHKSAGFELPRGSQT